MLGIKTTAKTTLFRACLVQAYLWNHCCCMNSAWWPLTIPHRSVKHQQASKHHKHPQTMLYFFGGVPIFLQEKHTVFPHFASLPHLSKQSFNNLKTRITLIPLNSWHHHGWLFHQRMFFCLSELLGWLGESTGWNHPSARLHLHHQGLPSLWPPKNEFVDGSPWWHKGRESTQRNQHPRSNKKSST